MSATPAGGCAAPAPFRQQTARTLFLLPARSWVRKGLEAYLTVLIEALWPKKRILQAYLNLVDWGHGNFGAEAAARAYFHVSAARLIACPGRPAGGGLPDPSKWSAVTARDPMSPPAPRP